MNASLTLNTVLNAFHIIIDKEFNTFDKNFIFFDSKVRKKKPKPLVNHLFYRFSTNTVKPLYREH